MMQQYAVVTPLQDEPSVFDAVSQIYTESDINHLDISAFEVEGYSLCLNPEEKRFSRPAKISVDLRISACPEEAPP